MNRISNVLTTILLTRHYVVSDEVSTDSSKTAYYNAFLLSNFGIVVDKPERLTSNVLEAISNKFALNVPRAFYNNPQDTLFYTSDELVINQFVNYFLAYGEDIDRIELFSKNLPQYKIGDELKLREFYVVTTAESHKILEEITEKLCAYTRPFSATEVTEFVELFSAGYYKDFDIKCKDNVFKLLELDKTMARFLDKKDIVKLSIEFFGTKANFEDVKRMSKYQLKDFNRQLDLIKSYLPYVHNCPMSKRQAKYYNKICKLCAYKDKKATNDQSPDKIAIAKINSGDILGAARVYAANGSMIERRLRFLLSRANPIEAVEILNMLPSKNPIVLYQLVNGILNDTDGPRTFTFTNNCKLKSHTETEYETEYRMSRLNKSTIDLVHKICLDKLNAYYKSLPTLGKIYIDPKFEKIALPVNTSACGKGIDVLPTGSRIPCNGDYIRTFVYWDKAFDIDSSLMLVKSPEEISTMGWFNYGSRRSKAVCFSGDITGPKGAEYFDIDLNELKAQGYKYIIQTFHGYNSDLNTGEIYAGYQVKNDLNTAAWDPKNIEMQFRVIGDSRACVAFAIDLDTREVVIINQILDSDDRVISARGFAPIEKFLNPAMLDVNMATIIRNRGYMAETPEEADIVFDDHYTIKPVTEDVKDTRTQIIVRSYELEKLVALINETID